MDLVYVIKMSLRIYNRMTVFRSLPVFILVGTLFFSCTGKFKMQNFDSKKWSSDKNGCLGYRAELINEILTQRTNVLGQRETNIRSTFGPPSKQELYVRNQKFFYYTISSDSCGAENKSLELRFNAIGLVKEMKLVSSL